MTGVSCWRTCTVRIYRRRRNATSPASRRSRATRWRPHVFAVQKFPHFARAIGFACLVMEEPHPLHEPLVGLGACAHPSPLPCIEATPTHLQDATHASQPKLLLMHLDKPVRHRTSLAKHAAADSTSECNTTWSPEQIAGWLKRRYPDEESLHVSHETIYRSLFIQTRGVLKKELQKQLRTQRVFRQSRHSNIRGLRRGQIIDGVPIAHRAPEVADRAVPGHWEGDLIAGRGNTHIATLVERHSRLTMLVKITGKDTKTVVRALSTHVRKLPDHLRQSLTWDRGMELADHKTFTLATDTQVYFCDPRSPWQRGTNENTNRLLRQYFPKGTDLSAHSQTELNRVAHQLNQRPRKTLGYATPADRLQASVALTG
jgi:IS30 family transposase